MLLIVYKYHATSLFYYFQPCKSIFLLDFVFPNTGYAFFINDRIAPDNSFFYFANATSGELLKTALYACMASFPFPISLSGN